MKVSVGGTPLGGGVGGVISVAAAAEAGIIVPTGDVVKTSVGGRIMNGVAVMIDGVFEENGDCIGKGCGATPQISQDESRSIRSKPTDIFFMT